MGPLSFVDPLHPTLDHRYTCKVLVPSAPPSASAGAGSSAGPVPALDFRSQKVKFVKGLTADRVRVETRIQLQDVKLHLVSAYDRVPIRGTYILFQ
jgi:hypothetical protein